MKPFLVVVVILSSSMDRVLPALHVLVSPYELFILGALEVFCFSPLP